MLGIAVADLALPDHFALFVEQHDEAALHAFNAKGQRHHLRADVVNGKLGIERFAGIIEHGQKIIFMLQLLDSGGQFRE